METGFDRNSSLSIRRTQEATEFQPAHSSLCVQDPAPTLASLVGALNFSGRAPMQQAAKAAFHEEEWPQLRRPPPSAGAGPSGCRGETLGMPCRRIPSGKSLCPWSPGRPLLLNVIHTFPPVMPGEGADLTPPALPQALVGPQQNTDQHTCADTTVERPMRVRQRIAMMSRIRCLPHPPMPPESLRLPWWTCCCRVPHGARARGSEIFRRTSSPTCCSAWQKGVSTA